MCLAIKWPILTCGDIYIELVATGKVAGDRIRPTAAVRVPKVEGCDGTATRRVSQCSAHRPAVLSTEWPRLLVAVRCGAQLRFVSSRGSLEIGTMI